MVRLIGDEHLKDDERWVRHLLEGTVGQTRVTDRKGGPEGRHDLEADLPDGGIAAIEITSEADAARLSVAAAVQRHLSNLKVPGSQLAWLVSVTPQADALALRKSTGLVALLAEMEQHGQSSASSPDRRLSCRASRKAFARPAGPAGGRPQVVALMCPAMISGRVSAGLPRVASAGTAASKYTRL